MPLCFDCHADMLSYDDRHPKGTKYRSEELKLHRDRWFEKIITARAADYTDAHKTLDQGLLRRILKLLPWSGSIEFISHNNFAGFSFPMDFLRDLDEFDALSSDPNCEFIDPILESMRASLAKHVSDFLILISYNTWPTNIEGRSSVPQDWEFERPKEFFEIVGKIHGTAQQCVDSYKTLIREGRHRLAVAILEENLSPEGHN